MNTWRGLHVGVGVFENQGSADDCAEALRLKQRCDTDEVTVFPVAVGSFTTTP